MWELFQNIKSSYSSRSVEAKASIWYAVSNIINQGISVLAVIVFTRLMPTSDYGQYSLYTSWYQIILIFATLNLWYYVFNKGMIKYKDDKESFIKSLQATSSVVTLLVAVVYFIFSSQINYLSTLPTIVFVSMFIQMLFEPSYHYWVNKAVFENHYKTVVLATFLYSIIVQIVSLIIVIQSIQKGLSRILSFSLLSALFYMFFFIKIGRTKARVKMEYCKYVLWFNLPLIPHFLSMILLNQMDRIMIGRMCSNAQAGTYGVAYSVATLSTVFSNAFQNSMTPWMYKKLDRNDTLGIQDTANFLVVILSLICSIIIALAPEMILIFAPEEYSQAMWIIPPVASSVVFIFVFNLCANIEYFYEENKFVPAASICSAIINAVTNYIFIKKYGFLAAGYTTLACYMLLAVFHFFVYIHVCKKHNVSTHIYSFRKIAIIVAAFLGNSVFLLFTYDYPVVRYSYLLIIIFTIFINRRRITSTLKILKQ